MGRFAIRYGDHVTRARRDGRPVVALESTIVSHGLPRPDNLRVAREIEQTVRDNGAVPATNASDPTLGFIYRPPSWAGIACLIVASKTTSPDAAS